VGERGWVLLFEVLSAVLGVECLRGKK